METSGSAQERGWVVGSQILTTLNKPKSIKKFWDLWDLTKYWDHAYSNALTELNHELLDQHLVITLYESGFRIPSKEGSARQ